MKRWLAVAVIIGWGLANSGFSDTNDLARPRKWTSVSGAELMAIFVQVSGDNVVLRNRTGERIQIPRAKLSAADQALLAELIAKRDARKVTKLSAIEQQIAKLKAEAAALAGEPVVDPEVVEG